jgi:hypothetical protein
MKCPCYTWTYWQIWFLLYIKSSKQSVTLCFEAFASVMHFTKLATHTRLSAPLGHNWLNIYHSKKYSQQKWITFYTQHTLSGFWDNETKWHKHTRTVTLCLQFLTCSNSHNGKYPQRKAISKTIQDAVDNTRFQLHPKKRMPEALVQMEGQL